MSDVIGVLALQGGFAQHIAMLGSIGVKAIEVRKPVDLDLCQGLIIPGGESTVIMKQLHFIKLMEPILEFAKTKPIFGTCAGLILMSNKILESPMQPMGLLDIEVERNAYGRQIESFTVDIDSTEKLIVGLRAVFIRAPRIKHVGPNVSVLASHNGEAVVVKQGHHLGATFHPELTLDSSLHRYFRSLVELTRID